MEHEEKKSKLFMSLIIDYEKMFNELEPFTDIDSIPYIPAVGKEMYDKVIIPNLIRCGAIPKENLIVGETYIGSCRNASEAVWDEEEFEYQRYKYGLVFPEKINHFQDDNGFDLFVPISIKK